MKRGVIALTEQCGEAHEIAGRRNDSATTSLLEVFIDETEKRTWFLFETTRRRNDPND